MSSSTAVRAIFALALAVGGAAGQTRTNEARKFDEFADIQTSDLKARLDNFAIQLSNEPQSKGFVVVYRSRRDLPGLSNQHAIRSKDYLVNSRGIAEKQIVTVDGGDADCLVQELWIVPPGTAPAPRRDAYQRYFPDLDAARKIDEFGYDPDTEEPRKGYPQAADYLETFANELRRDKTTLAYVIGYAHYSKKPELVGDEGYEVRYEKRIDPPGVLRRRMNFEKLVLVRHYGISANRIRLIDGGYRRWPALEFWIAPRGAHAPIPTPNAFPPKRGSRRN